MDFIEKLTGLDIDGGSGAAEWLLVILPIALVAFIVWQRARVHRARR
ncbi:MAG: hypothetical protein K1X67_17780 [Fimbriimonadaceae bacterium]|nr:hypothetical protein [Fimbriimonadaceae bacterium]